MRPSSLCLSVLLFVPPASNAAPLAQRAGLTRAAVGIETAMPPNFDGVLNPFETPLPETVPPPVPEPKAVEVAPQTPEPVIPANFWNTLQPPKSGDLEYLLKALPRTQLPRR